MEILTTNIRSFREAKGYSQLYVARKMGITQQAYSALEKNPSQLTLKKLTLLCKILEVDIMSLLKNDNILKEPSPNYDTKNTRSSHPEKEATDFNEKLDQLVQEVRLLRNKLDEK